MPYSTTADIYERIGQEVADFWADDVPANIVSSIDDADAEIDSHLAKRYPVPLEAASLPAMVKKMSVDIACYNLLSRRGADEDQADKVIIDRYKNAIRFLERVAEGKADLPIGDTDPTQPEVVVDVSTRDKKYGKRFEDEYDL